MFIVDRIIRIFLGSKTFRAPLHDIYKSSDNGSEVKGVFLDIYQAFKKVWHEG